MSRPGLQPQRTSLAWNRTTLATLGLLGAVGKVAADDPGPRTIACVAIVVAHTLVVAACAVARGNAMSAMPPQPLFVIAYTSTLIAGLAAIASIAGSW